MGSNPGNTAEIVMIGGGENFGNIYAGAMNGDYSGSTAISLTDVTGTQNGIVYIDGAKETYVDLDNFLDVEEPTAPEALGDYTVAGGVTVEIKNCDTKLVSRVSDVNISKAALVVDTAGAYNGLLTVENVDEITVKGGGIFAPVVVNECSVILKENSSIDLSNIETPKLVSIDSSDGTGNKLILDKKQTLEISGTITGELTFETSYGYDGKSGTAEYSHTYVSVKEESAAEILFTPSGGQTGMTLDKTAGQDGMVAIWKTSAAGEYPSQSVENLTVINPTVTTTVAEISGEGAYQFKTPQPFFVEIDWEDEIEEANEEYFPSVPIRYEIIFEGNPYTANAEECIDEDGAGTGYYVAHIPELGLTFEHYSKYDDDLEKDRIIPYRYLTIPEEQVTPAVGIYDITIIPQSVNEPIERKVTLIINEDVSTGESVTPLDTATILGDLADTVTMGESLQVVGTVGYSDDSLGNTSVAVPDGPIAIYINQKKYEASDLEASLTTENGDINVSIEVTEANGFQVGENNVVVVYEGAADSTYLARCSQAFTTVTVNPVSVKLQYDAISQQVSYNGQAASCQVPLVNVVRDDASEIITSNVIPEVFYKQGDAKVEPVLPGIYDVWFRVTGFGYDTLEEKAGTLTITAANPTVNLIAGTPADGKVQLDVSVNGSNTGSIPVGTVKFYQDGSEFKEETLRFGEASIEVSELEAGKTYTFKAEYVPDYAGSNPHYNTASSEIVKVTVSATENDSEDTGENTGGNGSIGGGTGENDEVTGGNTSGSGGSSSGGNTSGGNISGGGSNTSGGNTSGGGGNTSGSSDTVTGGNTGEDNDIPEQENDSDSIENENITVSISGTQKTKNSKVKVKVTKEIIEQVLADNNGVDTDVTIEVLNSKAEVAYKLTVNTADIKKGNKLYICEKDNETGEYILVNNKTYIVSKKGNVNISMPAKKHYVLMNEAEMDKVTGGILKQVKLRDKKLEVAPGEKAKIKFAEDFNMENVKSISYKSSKKKVVVVSKKGTVRAKKAGKATIKVKVTLKNDEVKVLKVKVVIKK